MVSIPLLINGCCAYWVVLVVGPFLDSRRVVVTVEIQNHRVGVHDQLRLRGRLVTSK